MSVSTLPRLRHLGVATMALACALALTGVAGAAQPGPAKPAKRELANPAAAEPGVAWASGDPEPAGCGRSRRKLWQAGEGWVVKTVTICR